MDEVSQKTHGHDYFYDPDCLLCEPPKKPEEFYLAGFATAVFVIVVSGLFRMFSCWQNPHTSEFFLGGAQALTVLCGLITCAATFVLSLMIVLVIGGAVTIGTYHLSRFMKYVVLRVRHGK